MQIFGPTPDLLNLTTWVLSNPPDDSDARSSLRTTGLEYRCSCRKQQSHPQEQTVGRRHCCVTQTPPLPTLCKAPSCPSPWHA